MKALEKLQLMRTLGVSDEKDLPDALQLAKSLKAFHDTERTRRIKKPSSSPALLGLERSLDAADELVQVWEERMVPPATDVLLALVNMGDSPRDIQEVRGVVPPVYDIAEESDRELLELRDYLRCFWQQLAIERQPGTGATGRSGDFGDGTKVYVILYKLWHKYELDSDGYWISWATGQFFPTQKNFRGIIARVLFDRRRYLARCPGCNQYFIKYRDDQKYCLAVTCKRKANNQRQQKYQDNKKKKSAHKSRRSA